MLTAPVLTDRVPDGLAVDRDRRWVRLFHRYDIPVVG
jgi:hypothetical protein